MPGHPLAFGVTVMVPVWVVATLAAVKLISPLPEAPRPMAGLELVQFRVGLPVATKLTATGSPAQTAWSSGSVSTGVGLIVMVNVRGTPGQVPNWGVTVIFAISWLVTLALVKLILPLPDAPSPTTGLSLVQLYVTPTGVPAKVTFTGAPAQTTTLAGWLAVGAGATVMVNNCGVPGQPPLVGVTVMVPVWVVATFAALKFISPLPEAPKPIAVLLLVQEKFGLPLPVNTKLTGSPAHTF